MPPESKSDQLTGWLKAYWPELVAGGSGALLGTLTSGERSGESKKERMRRTIRNAVLAAALGAGGTAAIRHGTRGVQVGAAGPPPPEGKQPWYRRPVQRTLFPIGTRLGEHGLASALRKWRPSMDPGRVAATELFSKLVGDGMPLGGNDALVLGKSFADKIRRGTQSEIHAALTNLAQQLRHAGGVPSTGAGFAFNNDELAALKRIFRAGGGNYEAGNWTNHASRFANRRLSPMAQVVSAKGMPTALRVGSPLAMLASYIYGPSVLEAAARKADIKPFNRFLDIMDLKSGEPQPPQQEAGWLGRTLDWFPGAAKETPGSKET